MHIYLWMSVVFVSSFDTMQRIWLVSISQRLFLSSAYNMPDSRAAVILVSYIKDSFCYYFILL